MLGDRPREAAAVAAEVTTMPLALVGALTDTICGRWAEVEFRPARSKPSRLAAPAPGRCLRACALPGPRMLSKLRGLGSSLGTEANTCRQEGKVRGMWNEIVREASGADEIVREASGADEIVREASGVDQTVREASGADEIVREASERMR